MWFSEMLYKILKKLSKADQPTEQEYRAWSLEKVRQERKEVWICDECRREAQAQIAAYDQPPPRTDPVLHMRLEQQRKKAEMKAFLHIDDSRELPKVSGDVVRRWNTQQLERLVMQEVTEPRVRKVHLVQDAGKVADDDKFLL